jgi:hypothetical protein
VRQKKLSKFPKFAQNLSKFCLSNSSLPTLVKMMNSDIEMNSDNETNESENDSDDDSNDDLEMDKNQKYYDCIVSVVAIVDGSELNTQRQQFFVRQRQKRATFAAHLDEEKTFCRYYRMEKETFYELKKFTGVLFTLDEEKSGCQTNWKHPIGIELVLHCLLRYLAGSSANDIRIACGISRPSFYCCLDQVISLILACKEL